MLHNYTNYSKPRQPAPAVDPTNEVKEEVVAPVVAEPAEPVIEDSEPEGILGVVTECVKLNVRKEPSTEADVVTTLPIATEVMVDIFESTEEFYKVTTGAGVEGYCMKKFININ